MPRLSLRCLNTRVRAGLAVLIGVSIAVVAVWLVGVRATPQPVGPAPEPIANLLDRAKAAIDRNETDAALKELDAILEREPEHGMALLYRGHVVRERGDLTAALADWRRVPDLPANIGGTARYLEGTVLIDLHRAREAERRFLRAIAMHPTYLPARERLLELYVTQLRAEDIRQTLRGINELRPWTLPECALQGLAGSRFRTDEQGTALMKAYAAADPRDRESRRALCRYHLEANRFEDAIKASRELLASDKADERAAAILITALLDSSKQAAADAVLRSYPLKKDSPASLWRVAGRLAFLAEDWRRAAFCLQQAIRIDPYDVAARYSLGTALVRSGRPEDAQRILKTATQLDEVERQTQQVVRNLDRDPALLASTAVKIAQLLLSLAYHRDAAAWFQQALQRLPGDPIAAAGYATCLRHLQQDQKLPRKVPGPERAELPKWLHTSRSPIGPERTKPAWIRHPGRIRLRDVHVEAGIDFQHFNGQSGFKYILETVGGGVAVLDYDRDGRPDMYFPQGSPLPPQKNDGRRLDRMFRNRGDATFADVTAAAGLGDPDFSQGAAVGDSDNDGFPDLVVANYGRNRFYRNNGDGTFSDVSEAVGFQESAASSGAAFADFDNDGLLDLYVVNYVADPLRVCRMKNGTIATCNPQNFAAEQDRLFRNRGDGTFEDVTASSGIEAAGGKGLGIVTADFDGDGKIDIYVANDGTPNFLFRNVSHGQGRLTFVEIGLISGTATNGSGRSEAGMGIACADFDADGRLDLYVTNFFGETNALYLNRGKMQFVDATARSGLAEPSRDVLGFGTQAVDLNLDGRPDLVVANGDIDDYRAQGRPWKMPPQVFANRGAGRFEDVGKDAGPYFAGKSLGRGMARLDFDGDGRPDLVVVHHDRPAALLRNETRKAGRALVLELSGRESNRDAIGANIRVTAGGRTQVHEVCGGGGFASSNEQRQFIGLDSARRVDALEIRWPGGKVDRWTNLPVDARITCVQGSGHSRGRLFIHPISNRKLDSGIENPKEPSTTRSR